MTTSPPIDQDYEAAVAIIGMSGRFPGAASVERLWLNLVAGERSIRDWSEEELLAAGVDPELLAQPNYVRRGTLVDDIDRFDAAFFGYPPREAEIMDPQHRLFLECAWEALEQAAYIPDTFPGLIGVFAGSGFCNYLTNHIATRPDIVETVGSLQIGIGNNHDSLASTVSYKLNLKGPSVAVQTYCSTSLVAAHLACQSLLTYESDLAIAGGVAIEFPQGAGYLYEEGGIVSPDGVVRTFDAQGQGSVMSSGAGVVVLKRVEDALADGDQIYAIIRGSAVNNDGQRKVGYTAPGLGGQSSVIVRALDNAGVEAESISYIEAHGTATPLGDAVEMAAMIKAFRASTDEKQFCAIGSVKPNIGHLDRASGVTGLIKTALSLTHEQLPPSLDFEHASPDVDIDNSPFFVNTALAPWPRTDVPRRAGVNSFGLGGTNAHVVLEEAPLLPPSGAARPAQVLVLSARTATALDAATLRLRDALETQPDLSLADAAYTLQVGRTTFNHRRIVVAHDATDAISILSGHDAQRLRSSDQTRRDRPVAFLLGGVGDHYAGLARELYEHEPTFRAAADQCCDLLQPLLGQDLRALLWPADAPAASNGALLALLGRGTTNPADAALQPTAIAQPAVFVVEYALAQLLASWGIKPSAMLGYSLGEYVAATLAGVLSLPDALRLVATRARLIDALPTGAMLAVALSEADVQLYLGEGVELAAVNGPLASVLAGPPDVIQALAARLEHDEVAARIVPTTHAFHTSMLRPIADQLTALARSLTLNAPTVPYISNVTGTWITPEQATDPTYWAQHLCHTVRFADGIAAVLESGAVVVEIGAGQGLSSFVKQHPACERARWDEVIATLPGTMERGSNALASAFTAIGRMWLAGVTVDWTGFNAHEQRRRVPLPTYPFERQRYWIEPAARLLPTKAASNDGKRPDIGDWFYQPVWQKKPLIAATTSQPQSWLIFMDDQGVGPRIAEQLETMGHPVVRVRPAEQFTRDDAAFGVRPDEPADYDALFAALRERHHTPTTILHLWSLDLPADLADGARFEAAQRIGFHSIFGLNMALSRELLDDTVNLVVVTNGMQTVAAHEQPDAEQAPLLGLCKVIGQENSSITCRSIDIALAERDATAHADTLLAECLATNREPVTSYRDAERWVQAYAPLHLPLPEPSTLRQHGVYVITGGMGAVGQILATYLAQTYQARLVITSRSALPDRSEWAARLAEPADATTRQIAFIQQLEALGAEVMFAQADVSDQARLRAVVDQTLDRFGALHGVLHAAGISDSQAFGVLSELRRDQCEQHFQPKVHGLYNLEAALGDYPLDFCLSFSSISTVLGGLTLGPYAAANSFMDAFTERHNHTHAVPWLAVNWDTWHTRPDQHEVVGATVAPFEMSPAEGAAAFERVIASHGHARIVNSTGDLDARIRQWVLLDTVHAATSQPSTTISTTHQNAHTASGDYEQRIAAIWQDILGIQAIGFHDNFFDLGGNSLIGLRVIARLKKEFKTHIPVVALFEAPTIHALAQYLQPEPARAQDQEAARMIARRTRARQTTGNDGIAIISMVGRFPGANSVDQFWQNLSNGVESLTTFSDEALIANGVDAELLNNPDYVKARPILQNVADFSASFFGYTPREAEMLDPQQRLFQECAWEALELAGYDSLRYPGLVGVFGGANFNAYLNAISQDPAIAERITESTVLGNDKDALTTSVSYKLNLTGPSFAVQTYCSTSLVATHLACRSLRNGECDMALAGGVSVRVPVESGYLYREGDQASSDGHCRTFDADASGATFGDGVAMVVLKRLDDAIADGDTIHAVIRGSAVNNDGGLKVGYTAPSVPGQTAVITQALDDAGVSPDSISYIEAHGTATPIGDPIEVAALTRAFRQSTDRTGYCWIGSVKPNVGHLDRAAGVTGLIKTVMALKHQQLPATLHFQRPNPEIDFEHSPFKVTTALTPWTHTSTPRRAGVNSLGVGGTNAHVVVEEAPEPTPSSAARPAHLFVLSAKTATALDAATLRLRDALETQPDLVLADAAYTLQLGRRQFAHRRVVVAHDTADALRRLDGAGLTGTAPDGTRTVAFLLGGVGDHYAGLARELYANEPTFRAVANQCCDLLLPLVGQDLRALLWPTNPTAATNGDLRALLGRGTINPADAALQPTAIAQPAVFVVEYAMAQLLASWGIKPSAMLGYSLGEYVAACLSGVLSLQDALRLVATRARLIDALPAGAMLAVALSEADVQPYPGDGVELAAVNGPLASVLAGPPDAIAALAARLERDEVACRIVPTTHAFHTSMLKPVADGLTALARSLTLNAPTVPYISNVTGTWITPEQATDPTYWAQHMTQTVRFADGIAAVLESGAVVVEVGAGQSLSSFVKQHPACERARWNEVIATLPGTMERGTDALASAFTALGRLWLAGVTVDWTSFNAHEQRRRVPLPTYPFERQRFWLTPMRRAFTNAPRQEPTNGKYNDIADWFAVPSWEPAPLTANAASHSKCWLVFAETNSIGSQLADRLAQDATVIRVERGTAFARLDEHCFQLRANAADDYEALFEILAREQRLPDTVIHAWADGIDIDMSQTAEHFEQTQATTSHSLIALAQALGTYVLDATVRMMILSCNAQPVHTGDILIPSYAPMLGLGTVITQENSSIVCRSVDIDTSGAQENQHTIDLLVSEVRAPSKDVTVAYRNGQRFAQRFTSTRYAPSTGGRSTRLRQHGVYLITGGLGGIGLTLADYLARTVQARLVLVSRTALPPRDTWTTWLADHDDGATSHKLRQLMQIEEHGGELLILSADVADAEQMRAVLDATMMRFGGLDGVIYAAGNLAQDGFQPIQALTPAHLDQHFRAKVYGLYVLENVLADHPLDFCILCSSISAVLGGLGYGGYTAANLFIDRFTYRHNQHSAQHWTAVNWDTWRITPETDAKTVNPYEMSPTEATDAFGRILDVLPTQVVNSTGNLDARIRQWVLLESLHVSVEPTSGQFGAHERPSLATTYIPPSYEHEQRIAAIWRDVLGLAEVGIDDNFFDLGGNSLIGLQVIANLKKEFKQPVPVVALFEAPTVRTQVAYLFPNLNRKEIRTDMLQQRRDRAKQHTTDNSIAIISMVGRFPGADTVDAFWHNLADGVESLTTFSDDDLLAAGTNPATLADPAFVKLRPTLSDVAQFDAAFFGYTPREAELLDPQQRLFHECAWEALELAGYDSLRYPGQVGVYGGASFNGYLTALSHDPVIAERITDLVSLENDKDALTTSVSYKLNLTGPSFAVQTYCSTSLVATHLACRALRHGECDMALAGGVSVRFPVESGYLYREGDQVSIDGHCRTFDADAAGANFGDGVAMVVLKRLEDAIEDGDTIHAVIRGSAINNDGGLKVGYTAPSIPGQAAVVTQALDDAGVSPDSISYIEAHGTATPIGDPIEVAALTRAFRQSTDRTGYCWIGSVKPNVGHLDRAAGVTGLIKTVMALKHQQLPATLHFQRPNPEIDFEHSPFKVTTALTPWTRTSTPRRAGVNSLGVGGTNAHVVVEEAPEPTPGSTARPTQVLVLSAKTATALDAATLRLRDALEAQPDVVLADAAYTLQLGRRQFAHRRVVVAHDTADALRRLDGAGLTGTAPDGTRTVAFLLGGVGDHYAGLARELYANEPTFRAAADQCCDLFQPLVGQDLRTLLWPATSTASSNGDLRALLGRGSTNPADAALQSTAIAQPAVFVVEYALAQLLASWGVQPSAMLGYSLGEYVAACLSGVLNLQDALRLVATRARLIDALPAGAMLAVALNETDVQSYLGEGVELAAVNGPLASVLAGPPDVIQALAARLEHDEVAARMVPTTHAFHTSMLRPIADQLTALARSLTLNPPTVPYISNVTGTWITPEQATDPTYWAQHLTQTVRFADGIAAVLESGAVVVEIGAGQSLSSFVKQHPNCERARWNEVIATLPGTMERGTDALASAFTAVGRLWLAGVTVDWQGFNAHEQRRRVPLPTYPFERQRFWLTPNRQPVQKEQGELERLADISDWFHVPSWRRSSLSTLAGVSNHLVAHTSWLIFADTCGLGAGMNAWLAARQQRVVMVTPGTTFRQTSPTTYELDPARRDDYDKLLQSLEAQSQQPSQIVHLWSVTPPSPETPSAATVETTLHHGFYSLLALTQALADYDQTCHISVVSSAMQEVTGTERIEPAKSTLLGPCKIIPQEHASLSCRSIDIIMGSEQVAPDAPLIQQLALELVARSDDRTVALRGRHRWVQDYEPLPLPPINIERPSRLRHNGVYLITGGLGGIALALADHLYTSVGARLVLLARTALPPRSSWSSLLADPATTETTRRRIEQVSALEVRGAEVLVVQADVADAAQVRAAVMEATARFGTINGVFHTAGVPGVGLMQLKTPATAASVLAPKVFGTLALAEAVRDLTLDCFVLFSSVTSATGGGPGQADYCAANAFLDAFARQQQDQHGLTVAVSWGEWQWDAWSDGLQGFHADVREHLIQTRRRIGIDFADGMNALDRVLNDDQPHIFITTQHLLGMVERSERGSAVAELQKHEATQHSDILYPRPMLATSYVAPSTETEHRIAALWEEVLGIEAIGVDDNFFELGGNSLLGIDLITRVRKELRLDRLPAYVLYEAPSIHTLAAHIEQSGNTDQADELDDRTSRRRSQLSFLQRRAQTGAV